jgi:hypothetical protein
MGGVGDDAEEEPVGTSRDYADCMTCTSYASMSGTSGYWTQTVETEGVRLPFGGQVDVEDEKP